MTSHNGEKGYFSQKRVFSQAIKEATHHHLESFNWVMDEGIGFLCQRMNPVELIPRSENLGFSKMSFWFDELKLGMPHKETDFKVRDARLTPSECRQRGITYGAPFIATICRKVDNDPIERTQVSLGNIPVMVKSSHCHLQNMNPQELVKHQEDANEFGGFFVLNGIERLVRMLIIPKRNYPVALERPIYIGKGANFSEFAVSIRSVRDDLYAQTMNIHSLNNGNTRVRISLRKQEFLIPSIILLKAFTTASDIQIYNRLVKTNEEDSQMSVRIEAMLKEAKNLAIHSQDAALAYLGSRFRYSLGVSSEFSDIEAGKLFLNQHILVHLDKHVDKFNMMCLMLEKLYMLVAGRIREDSADSLINQEALLSGHLYQMILKEKLEDVLMAIRGKYIKEMNRSNSGSSKIKTFDYFKKFCETHGMLAKKMEYFLATGNLVSQTGLALMQVTGYTIVADKLNMLRYLSHFRAIHRGQYFAQMKTTSVRKLLPDSWGFLCPVHTPDGGPCGLLNHISSKCKPLPRPAIKGAHTDLVKLCAKLGMSPVFPDFQLNFSSKHLPVVLDGKLIGYFDPKSCGLPDKLRNLKVNQDRKCLIPETLEIAYLPPSGLKLSNQFPGLFLATSEARFTRPVKNLAHDKVEWIGPLEQVYMSIACVPNDVLKETTHQELHTNNILSMLASDIPFPDYNQSPRNMYQCQMAKQTMGTPMHNFPYRVENKSYRLMNPQTPMVHNAAYDNYGFEEYPNGCNAVVAVISYTGFDMEDAMIINKSAYERGFGHGCVYKSYNRVFNDANTKEKGVNGARYKMLGRKDRSKLKASNIDYDGLPKIGTPLVNGEVEMCLNDTIKEEVRNIYNKDGEKSRVEEVRIVGSETNKDEINICYKLRINRNPVIGDKFSSRHGQKGVMSQLWPQTDMPFCESGITPDLIINPHAFPSRMTIGMLIESMAGKSGALHGFFQDSTPFQKYPNDSIIEYFGNELTKAGYNYYGNELLYSGIYGEPFRADIFIGVVYYQRLRHMVSDKSQARSTGPIDALTQQPVKGRKHHKEERWREMPFIAHGISYAPNDRLMRCSDYSEGYVCRKCGSILSSGVSVKIVMNESEESQTSIGSEKKLYCKICESDDCEKVTLPFGLRYLTNE